MKKNFILTITFMLALMSIFGQAKTLDKEILKDFASKLNGYWKSNISADVARFIISNKDFKGQMFLPFEIVQQAPPITIKLIMSKAGKLNLIQYYTLTQTDTLDISIADNKLILDKSIFYRQKSR
jgi:hypothetical protein